MRTPAKTERLASFHHVTTPDVTSAQEDSFKLDPTAMTSQYVRREAIASDFPDIDMECGDGNHGNTTELKQRLSGNDCLRAPSPGMDTYADMTDLDYGYVNGYGDTAEVMPDDVSGYGYDRKHCFQLQGVKNKGWH